MAFTVSYEIITDIIIALFTVGGLLYKIGRTEEKLRGDINVLGVKNDATNKNVRDVTRRLENMESNLLAGNYEKDKPDNDRSNRG